MTPIATILLVDDDIAIQEGVADLLQIYDYEVITAADGREALQEMQKRVPDLIISDIMMPGMDGYELFEAVRSNPAWTPIPFVFLTARGQQKDVRLGNRLGVDAYLTKPFEPDDLLIMVQSRLKRIRDIQSVTYSDVDRMKQQLITIFSHELRTPLTYIYGYVNLLQEQHSNLDKDAVDDMLIGVRRGADRLVKLVEDLMLVVRIDSGVVGMEIALRRSYEPLVKIVDKLLTEQRAVAQSRNVEFVVNIDRDIAIPCMALYLEDALKRLIDNAVKFSKQDGGEVRISANHEQNYVVLSIVDNGIGIDPVQIDHAFERFAQIDRDIMEQQGVGLGLTLARTLVRLHGGDIRATSQPGKGSVFNVYLPTTEVPLGSSLEEQQGSA